MSVKPGQPHPFQTIETFELNGPPPPPDAEFNRQDFTPAFARAGLGLGRCFGSKSRYRDSHPRCIFIPNANVFSRKKGRMWWGDLDLSNDRVALERVARQMRTKLYVISEFDGRFDEAEKTLADLISAAVWHTGGHVHIQGRRGFLQRSGFNSTEAALLLRLRRGRLNQRNEPKVALEIYRRMRRLEEVFIPIASKERLKMWGHWWTKPNEKLAGRSPMSVLKSGETLNFASLTEPTIGLLLFAINFSVSSLL